MLEPETEIFQEMFYAIINLTITPTGVWFDKSKKSWKMGSRPGSPFGLEDKAPLNLLDV